MEIFILLMFKLRLKIMIFEDKFKSPIKAKFLYGTKTINFLINSVHNNPI